MQLRLMGKLGRAPLKAEVPVVWLHNYTDPDFLEHPKSWDWTPAVKDFLMLGNDRVGDCTVAAILNWFRIVNANNGIDFTPTTQQALGLYSTITGYDQSKTQPDGSNPTDQGGVETDILSYFQTTGFEGHKVKVWMAIDPKDINHVNAAIYWFCGVYAGVMLPADAEEQFSKGKKWTISSLAAMQQPLGGHAVPYFSFEPDRRTGQVLYSCSTWALRQYLTGNWHWGCCDEVYAVLTEDMFKNGKSPNGLDMEALQDDLKRLEENGQQ